MTMPSEMDALMGHQLKAGDNQLKNISGLIDEEDCTNQELATAEAMASDAKARRSELRNKLIPEAMLDAGMREFTTDSGVKAKIAFATDGALGSPKTPEEYQEREDKLDLIIAHGGAEIVKMTVALDFPKDMFTEADDFLMWVRGQINVKADKDSKWKAVGISKQRTVNHMTLGSWIRSRMEADKPEDQLPQTFLDRLGIWYGEIAKITRPKAKTGG